MNPFLASDKAMMGYSTTCKKMITAIHIHMSLKEMDINHKKQKLMK
jgi:hypothetical protein